MAYIDPFLGRNPFDDPYGTVAAPRSPALPPLTPEEQEGLLSKVGSGALHGLGWIGGSLGKAFGGRAIRGLMGGRPEELLSIIPWSDTLGITDPSKEVTGAELLGNKNADFLSPEGIGGLVLEAALDPATYLTGPGAALTSLGRTAAKAGIKVPTSIAVKGLAAGTREADDLARVVKAATPQATQAAKEAAEAAAKAKVPLGSWTGPVSPMDLAEVAGKPLGGHVGVGLPFMDPLATFDLSRPLEMAGNVASKIPGAQTAWNATGGLRRGFNAMFEKGVREQTLPEMQTAARWATTEDPLRQFSATGPMADLFQQFQRKVGWAPGMEVTQAMKDLAVKHGDELADIVERIPNSSWDEFRRAYPTKAAEAEQFLAKADPELVEMGNRYRVMANEQLNAARALGHPDQPLDDFVQYMRRQRSVGYNPKPGSSVSMVPEAQGEREKFFKGLFRNQVNEIAMSPQLRQMPEKDAADAILGSYLGFGPTERAEHNALVGKVFSSMSKAETDELFSFFNNAPAANTPAQMQRYADLMQKAGQSATQPELARLRDLTKTIDQSKKLANWQKGLDPLAIDRAGGFFANHPLADLESYIGKETSRQVNTEAAYRAMGQMAKPGAEIPLASVLKELGLTNDVPAKQLLAESIAGRVVDPADVDQIIAGLGVTRDQRDALSSFVKPAAAPAGAAPWLSLIDSALNLTKAGQTSWPATQMRNLISDVFMRTVGGGSPIAPLGYGKTLREGGTIPGLAKLPLFAGMTDEQASQKVLEYAHRLGIKDTKKYQALDYAGLDPGISLTKREMPFIGAPQTGLGETLRAELPGLEDFTPAVLKSGESKIDPRNIRGSSLGADRPRQTSGFFPVAQAQSVQSYLEDTNRLGTFVDSLMRGNAPQTAMRDVINAHFDFSNLSRFEKEWMRRIFPFYSWHRQSMPRVIGELATNPGGIMGQTMRTLNAASGEQGFFPQDLSTTGYAIPVGEKDQTGRRNYLTSTGLNFEDLAMLTSLSQMASATTPFLRVPAEVALGRQFFTGRDIPANYPVPDSPLANELLMASPIGRAFSTGRMVANAPQRGGLLPAATTLLGPRVTNVDQEAARRIAIRQYAENELRGEEGVRQFERMYVRPEDLAKLTPEQLQQYRLLLSLGKPSQFPPVR